MVISLFKRELLLAYRQPSDWINPLVFFLMVITLFPLGISAELSVLSEIAGGVLWVAALLSTLMAMDAMFKQDFADGSLEQAVVSASSLELIILIKTLVQWLKTGVTLTLVSPVLAMMLGFPAHAMGVLMLSLLIGSFSLIFIGAIGAALTVSLKRGGVLLSLLVIPLFVPVIIFGTALVQAALLGRGVGGILAILAAMALGALIISPIASAQAIRISISEG